ncbi:MAG TPA: cupin domain-containing protein [Chloroflexota bacterium]|jgi:quercetin dioxygenase-like cupin family protein|nr:cupin domain-containing protein [Chloroflexota bacterium]
MAEQLLNTHPTGKTTGTTHRPPYAHSGQALTFDLATEVQHLRQEDVWARSDHNARTLYKDHDLRIVLIAMKAGSQLAEHIVAGRIAIQVLSGQLRLQVPGQNVDLPAGRLLALPYAVHYELEAEEESAFLLTIAYTKAVEGNS